MCIYTCIYVYCKCTYGIYACISFHKPCQVHRNCCPIKGTLGEAGASAGGAIHRHQRAEVAAAKRQLALLGQEEALEAQHMRGQPEELGAAAASVKRLGAGEEASVLANLS